MIDRTTEFIPFIRLRAPLRVAANRVWRIPFYDDVPNPGWPASVCLQVAGGLRFVSACRRLSCGESLAIARPAAILGGGRKRELIVERNSFRFARRTEFVPFSRLRLIPSSILTQKQFKSNGMNSVLRYPNRTE
jgi:hypothetical protein